jgi:ABC-type nickel/cobalt efflux system permease component RcnA
MSSSSSQNDRVSPKTAAKSIPSGSTHHKHGEKSAKHHDDHEHRRHSHSHHGSTTAASNRGTPPSVTLSIFSAGLSPRARALAIASSIAINFVLPFINGVMLGFGEIFAKNFVAPLFGIRPPSVASVGVRTPTAKDRRR